MLEVKCLLSMTCKSEDLLRENIREALRLEGLKAQIKIIRVNEKIADRLKMKGSPTIFINDLEIQPQNVEGTS
jgi:protein-disulfide isomerase